jgi:methylmalonyl-CoA/ethylmalonyl-CoA epimerase
VYLDRLAESLLELETLNKDQLDAMLADIEPESRSAETVAPSAWCGDLSLASRSMAAKSIHHLGVAVEDPRRGDLDLLASLRCRAGRSGDAAGAGLSRPRRCVSGRAHVELLAALGDDTPVGRFLSRRGPGMHHVAYEVDDLSGELARLEDEGAELIDASPRQGLFGMQVAFVHPSLRTASSRSWSPVAERGSHRDWVRRRPDHGGFGRVRSCRPASSRRCPTVRTGRSRWDVEDGRYTVALRRIVYVKRFARRRPRVGFGGLIAGSGARGRHRRPAGGRGDSALQRADDARLRRPHDLKEHVGMAQIATTAGAGRAVEHARKITPAAIRVVDVPGTGRSCSGNLRQVDGLLMVVRNPGARSRSCGSSCSSADRITSSGASSGFASRRSRAIRSCARRSRKLERLLAHVEGRWHARRLRG